MKTVSRMILGVVVVGSIGCLVVAARAQRGGERSATTGKASAVDASRSSELSYSGRGELSFFFGNLVFIPESVEVDTVMGLPVVFAAEEPDKSIDPVALLERATFPTSDGDFYDLVGHIQMRFDPTERTLSVLAVGDEGRVFERRFELSPPVRSDGQPSYDYFGYVESYFAYMSTGARPAYGETPGVGNVSGSGPEGQNFGTCQCVMSKCASYQTCKANEKCLCVCSEPDRCRCTCSPAAE